MEACSKKMAELETFISDVNQNSLDNQFNPNLSGGSSYFYLENLLLSKFKGVKTKEQAQAALAELNKQVLSDKGTLESILNAGGVIAGGAACIGTSGAACAAGAAGAALSLDSLIASGKQAYYGEPSTSPLTKALIDSGMDKKQAENLVLAANLGLVVINTAQLAKGTFKFAVGGKTVTLSADELKAAKIYDGGSSSSTGGKVIEYEPSGSVVSQGNKPWCGPASCNMVINDKTGRTVDLTDVVGQFDEVRKGGVNLNEIKVVLGKNGVSSTSHKNLPFKDLDDAVTSGKPVIFGVHVPNGEKHWIVIDEIRYVDGIKYYMTRDPMAGPRGIRFDALQSKATGNAIVVGGR